MTSRALNQELRSGTEGRLPTIPKVRLASSRNQSSPSPVHVGIFQQLVDGLAEQAALIDAHDGTILAVNDSWAETVTLNGFSDFAPGNNYYAELGKVAAAGYAPGQAALDAIEEMRQGKRSSFRLVYDGGGRQVARRFEARIGLLEAGGRKYIRVTRYDITELALLRSMQTEFSGALMRVQEYERRRFGRELHDSGMQVLAALGISLARLKRDQSREAVGAVTSDMEDLLIQAQKEFRSISFLAHPPLVEELGLVEALQSLVEGFGKRAGLETTFVVEGKLAGLGNDAEHVVYRVAQEALSNAHRHSRASRLSVRLVARSRILHLVIGDDGRGIPADLRPGVGLQSMRERLGEIRGRIAIRDASPGTIVLASLPLPVTARAAAPG